MFFSRKVITEDELVDLHGKVAIVTGGNTGIGYATIEFLARRGARVYMGSRNQGRAQKAIEEIEAKLQKSCNDNQASIHWLQLDLSDPRSVKEAATEFIAKEERLDILVNNASHSSFGPYKLNQDGLLDIMVVNHISHFVLTETLLPLLRHTATLEDSDVRIVNVSSTAHTHAATESFAAKENLNKQFGDSVTGYLATYGHSKLANILHIKNLQTRLKAQYSPITCLAVHPGAVMTVGASGFLNSVPFFGWLLKVFFGPLFFTSWTQGAMTSAFAAAGKEVAETRKSKDEVERRKYEGGYLVPVANISEPSTYAKDERLQRELYETTMEVLTEMGIAFK
ncbi:NAD-P-binding protein [Lentinula aff. detonsa]|uniref:NAD-P-binding protein n=1 Tax=Lentinula aff. detonsa TaxID=2804958 RepID=A0AA38KVI9_9AGAR|nr:NAD-P-binding protein [Lentinula aff. detonsa]